MGSAACTCVCCCCAQAKWAQEGLQTDSLSVENGAIMAAASRWPLMIDPQLQGVRWIVSKEARNGLVIIQQSQPKYIDQARRPHALLAQRNPLPVTEQHAVLPCPSIV